MGAHDMQTLTDQRDQAGAAFDTAAAAGDLVAMDAALGRIRVLSARIADIAESATA